MAVSIVEFSREWRECMSASERTSVGSKRLMLGFFVYAENGQVSKRIKNVIKTHTHTHMDRAIDTRKDK